MPRISAVAAAAAAACLLLPAAAGAALPSNRDRTIVPGTSIGGVRIGMRGRQAVATWGPSRCAEVAEILCHYEAVPSSANFNTGNAAFQLRGGKVVAVSLTSAYSPGSGGSLTADISRALAKYKTAGGLRLGATVAQLKRAYPAAKGRTTAGGASAAYSVGSGARTTQFRFIPVNGTLRLFSLRIGAPEG